MKNRYYNLQMETNYQYAFDCLDLFRPQSILEEERMLRLLHFAVRSLYKSFSEHCLAVVRCIIPVKY